MERDIGVSSRASNTHSIDTDCFRQSLVHSEKPKQFIDLVDEFCK